MINKIFEYLQNHFGTSNPGNLGFTDNQSRSSKAGSDESQPIESNMSQKSFDPNTNKILQLREVFMIGFSLFNAGDRAEAIPVLEKVLDNPFKYPTFRMVAACMLGETYRGVGDFEQANDYYKLSIHESDLIPDLSRSGNEWYTHYRPRAAFGLITVLRRSLSEDHKLIKSLLKDVRDQYQEYPNQDLMAQLNVVEGVYIRQLGDVEGSIYGIDSGIKKTLMMAPPYLFWHPEHFQAMLLLSYLIDPGYSMQTSRLAREIIKDDKNPWSTAIALAVSIQNFLKRNISSDPEKKLHINPDQHDKISNWFACLNESVVFEKDPFLTTEIVTLEAIWNIILNKEKRVLEEITQLIHFMDTNVSELIWLLRSIELASIKGILLKNDQLPKELLDKLWGKGANILRKYSSNLKSYGCQQSLIDHCFGLLTDITPAQNNLNNWNSEPIRLLRLRLWP